MDTRKQEKILTYVIVTILGLALVVMLYRWLFGTETVTVINEEDYLYEQARDEFLEDTRWDSIRGY